MPSPTRPGPSRSYSPLSGQSVPAPIRDRAPRGLSSIGGLAAVLALVLLPAAAQGQLTLTSFDPTIASPGTSIALDGSGFVADPEAHAAFVIDPLSDAGTLIDIGSATPARLDGVLGPVSEPFIGRVRASVGTCWTLPGGLHRGQWATYLVRQGQWFVPSAVAEAPGEMVVSDPSPSSLSAVRAVHSLVISFEDWPNGTDGPDCGIDLDILVDGGTGTGSGDDPAGGPTFRIFSTGIGIVEQHMAYEPAVLVSDLAPILESTYGALGLHFTAEGTDLHVTWDGAPVLDEGFAVLSLSQ